MLGVRAAAKGHEESESDGHDFVRGYAQEGKVKEEFL